MSSRWAFTDDVPRGKNRDKSAILARGENVLAAAKSTVEFC